jgi:hypothetical protein
MGSGYFYRRRRTRGVRRACALPAMLAGALLPAQASAQVSDTATAQARAAILASGTMVKTADMDFGVIAQPSNAGTVVLTPSGTPICMTTGGLVRTGPCVAAEFAVMERRNGRLRIRENNGGVVTLGGPGGATMTMTGITISAIDMSPVSGANGWNLGRYQIDSNSGIARFRLGGTLNVGAAQAPGAYSGTIVVETNFN